MSSAANIPSASGVSRELVDAHRAWVLEVGREKDLQPTQIAKKAGLTATTLTRLVNDPDHPHALSSTTIDKIVRALGVTPPVSPENASFRAAVQRAVASLHRQSALQLGTPEAVAASVLELADWLMKAGNGGADQFDAIVSFETERLRRQRST